MEQTLQTVRRAGSAGVCLCFAGLLVLGFRSPCLCRPGVLLWVPVALLGCVAAFAVPACVARLFLYV